MATPALPKSTMRAAEPADRIPWGQQHIPQLGRNPPAASNATDRCLLHYRVMRLDPVALIDIEQLRFRVFDYVLKKALTPELLKDKVNYQ